MLNRSGKNKHPFITVILGRKVFSISKLGILLAVGLPYILYFVEKFASKFVSIFIMNGCVKYFFYTYLNDNIIVL